VGHTVPVSARPLIAARQGGGKRRPYDQDDYDEDTNLINAIHGVATWGKTVLKLICSVVIAFAFWINTADAQGWRYYGSRSGLDIGPGGGMSIGPGGGQSIGPGGGQSIGPGGGMSIGPGGGMSIGPGGGMSIGPGGGQSIGPGGGQSIGPGGGLSIAPCGGMSIAPCR